MGCEFSKNSTKAQTVPRAPSSESPNKNTMTHSSSMPEAANNKSDVCKEAVPLVADHTSTEERPIAVAGVQRVCLGAGCYWGTEKYVRDFAKNNAGLGTMMSATVGFMGPESAPANPTYQQVCSGATGHVEVLNVEYKGGNEYFEAMIRYFFQFHDPTTMNRQGNDKGGQYASFIYCDDDQQVAVAEKVKKELQDILDKGSLTCFTEKQVTTKISKYTIFYPAHEEHQEYLYKNPNGYCNHRVRFTTWPSK